MSQRQGWIYFDSLPVAKRQAALLKPNPNSVFPFTVSGESQPTPIFFPSKLKTGFLDRYDLQTSYKKT